MSDTPITLVAQPPLLQAPAPWLKCKADTYWIPYYHNGPLPEDAYALLEARTPSFSSPSRAGEFKGGLAMIQIVRYHETPVGGYNELILAPGSFDVPKTEPEQGTERGQKRKTPRISRIYVDQEATAFNGRKNWNIPKHLARFSFERLTSPDRLKVQVFPPLSTASTTETDKPFFSATFQPFTYIPALPFSTKISPWLGVDVTLTQPPLLPQPADNVQDLAPELRAGSEEWLQVKPLIECSKMKGCWVDYVQPTPQSSPGSGPLPNIGKGNGGNGEKVHNTGWFPTLHPFKVGLWMEGAEITLGKPEVL